MREKEFSLSLGQLEVNFRLKEKSKEEEKVTILSSQDWKTGISWKLFLYP